MIKIPLLDKLREVRRRLSEEQNNDPARYAEMLRRMAQDRPGTYITEPLPPVDAGASASTPAKGDK